MSVTETHYFALLRAALFRTPVAIDGPVDWEAVLQLANRHANQALLCEVASQMTGDNRPSDAMQAAMQATMRSNLISQLRLKQILVSALRVLREHNIEPVLLKGFSLAMLYPNPSLRHFGDIDLFIGLDNFHEACRVLRTLPGGYNWGDETDSGKHYNIEFGNYPMEIHRVSAEVIGPDDAATYAAIERDGLLDNAQHVSFEDLDITIPSKEFMVFFTFFHAWEHFMTSGVGWRQISDVAMTLHTYLGSQSPADFDTKKLRSWLESMHLMQPWQAFGWLMVDCLGLPEAEMPFYDTACHRTAQKLYDRVMVEGNFQRNGKFKQRQPKGRMAKKMHSFVGIFVDGFQLAQVFPKQAFQAMHTSLKSSLNKNFR